MEVVITEYLKIDLASEQWLCRSCGGRLGPAREDYKRGLLVYDRDPREIHKPLLDPALYAYTYAPDPAWCAMLEFYCPHCGALVEVEYTVPGHPPLRDVELDLDRLKEKWVAWSAAGVDPDRVRPGELRGGPARACQHAHRHLLRQDPV